MDIADVGASEEPHRQPPADRPVALREVPWRWGDVAIGLAPIAVLRVLPLALGRALFSVVPRWTWIPVTVLALGWLFLFPWWFGSRRTLTRPRVPSPRRLLIEGLIALAGLPVVVIAMSAAVQVLVRLSGTTEPPPVPFQGLALAPNRVEFFAFMALAIAVAPVAEETFFRGFVYCALRRRLNVAAAAFVQAAVFGLMHPFDYVNGTAVAVVGFIFALVYEWRKTLLTSVLLHALVNTAAMAILAAGAAAYYASPMLGVSGEAHAHGCLVTVVAPGSAAEVAGLRVGDVITAIDEHAVADVSDILQIVRGKQVGDRIAIEILRDGEAQQLAAVLKKRRE
jgi:membrane protease YdiL (CAAX protease family)